MDIKTEMQTTSSSPFKFEMSQVATNLPINGKVKKYCNACFIIKIYYSLQS